MIYPCEIGEPVRTAGGAALGLMICGQPAIALYRGRCQCGHVVERWACARHELIVASPTGCRLCLLVDYHNCPMTIERIEPAA